MDEFETVEAPAAGGLSQASTAPAASPAVAPAQAPVAQPSEYDKAMASYQKQRQELLATQQRLIESLESRVSGPQEMLWSLAQAFSAPTRTGSFGESFGHATQALGQFQGQQRQQMSEIAKMRAEMAAQQVGMAKEDVELARANEVSRGLQQMIGGTATESGAASAIPSNIAAAIKNRLAVNDIKGAQDLYEKYIMESEKKPEKVKEFEYYLGQLQSPAAKTIAQQLAANNYFLGSPADRAKAILDIRKAIDEGTIPAKEGNILIQGMTMIGGATEQAAPQAVKPAATPSSFPRISPEEQAARDKAAQEIKAREQTGAGIPTSTIVSPKQEREIAAKGAEVTATKRAEAEEARRESLQQRSENATRIINDANAVFDFASKQPAAFGILSKPGISSALLTLVQNGIRVGNFSVGLNDVQDAIRKAGGTQADIDAAAAVAQIAVQTSLDLAAGVKGSVSNYEQGLFQQASFSANDSPAVLKYKAELARARGEFDKFVWNKYRQFEKSGGRGLEDFKDTPDYKNYVKQYESALSKIRGTYFR